MTGCSFSSPHFAQHIRRIRHRAGGKKLCCVHGGTINRRRLVCGNAGVAVIASPHSGSLNDSPLVSTAQAMRAYLAAMATTAFQYPRRSRNAIAQRLRESVLLAAALSTALAPSTSRLRR